MQHLVRVDRYIASDFRGSKSFWKWSNSMTMCLSSAKILQRNHSGFTAHQTYRGRKKAGGERQLRRYNRQQHLPIFHDALR